MAAETPTISIEMRAPLWVSHELRATAQSREGGHMIWRLDVPEKSTVRDVMGRLAAELAGIGQFVFDAQDGEFRPDFILVLNHRLLDLRGGLGAELEDGDQLAIIQAIPGG